MPLRSPLESTYIRYWESCGYYSRRLFDLAGSSNPRYIHRAYSSSRYESERKDRSKVRRLGYRPLGAQRSRARGSAASNVQSTVVSSARKSRRVVASSSVSLPSTVTIVPSVVRAVVSSISYGRFSGASSGLHERSTSSRRVITFGTSHCSKNAIA